MFIGENNQAVFTVDHFYNLKFRAEYNKKDNCRLSLHLPNILMLSNYSRIPDGKMFIVALLPRLPT